MSSAENLQPSIKCDEWHQKWYFPTTVLFSYVACRRNNQLLLDICRRWQHAGIIVKRDLYNYSSSLWTNGSLSTKRNKEQVKCTIGKTCLFNRWRSGEVIVSWSNICKKWQAKRMIHTRFSYKYWWTFSRKCTTIEQQRSNMRSMHHSNHSRVQLL